MKVIITKLRPKPKNTHIHIKLSKELTFNQKLLNLQMQSIESKLELKQVLKRTDKP